MKFRLFLITLLVACSLEGFAQKYDDFKLKDGTLRCYFLGHGSLYFDWNGYIIYADPVKPYADYSKLPKADLVLITHNHGDHLDTEVLGQIQKQGTKFLMDSTSQKKWTDADAVAPGDRISLGELSIEAVPAYNTTNTNFHPKDRKDVGYVMDFGGFRVYVAGDCEDMPELASLKDIDVAFLPMNQPYTMTAEQGIKAARMFNPKILYPYHYRGTSLQPLIDALKGSSIEVRVRALE